MKDNEKILSDFIDSLNNEKRPAIETDYKELEVLYDIVRQVKSLKEPVMPDKDFSDRISKSIKTKNKAPAKKRRKIWIGSLASIAAIVVIAVMMNFINPRSNTNIVYAMEQAYNEMETYHGILKVVSKNEAGEEQVQSIIDIWADKDNNYYMEVLEGSYKGLKTISNGEKVWQHTLDENAVNVFPIFTETYEFIFELGTEIDNVRNAESTKVVGDGNIAGRPAYIMEITPKGGLTYKLWVDKETKLPLQKEGSIYKAIQYTTSYTEINFLDSIPKELIEVDKAEGFKEVDLATDKFVNIIEDNEIAEHNPEIKVEVNMEIEHAEQISVDSGSSPWKLDPIYVAQVFISLQLSPEGIVGEYPINYEDMVMVENDGIRALIEVNSEKMDIKTVYLERLVRQDDTGIWTVTGYDM